jgi:hypothetical protein
VLECSPREMLRRVRLGAVQKLTRDRCGHALPEDDAGLEYLIEMLKPISLGREPHRKMVNAVEVFAPWMPGIDVEQVIGLVMRMPLWERWPNAKLLGESLRLTNAERERLRLWPIAPCDVSKEELAEQRKAKARQRARLYRAKHRTKSRAEYLAQHSISRTKPWEVEGKSRRTWYRERQRQQMAQVPCA